MFPVDREASLPLGNGTQVAIKAKRSKLSRKEKSRHASSLREHGLSKFEAVRKRWTSSGVIWPEKPGSSPATPSRKLA